MFYCVVIKRICGVEENPRPKLNSCDSFSILHGNLKSISRHNFLKMSFLCAYIFINKSDNTLLSETYLDLIVSPGDNNLELLGYNVVCTDNPPNTKRAGF